MKKNNTLIIIGRLSYPSATAPSNRVHLYSKALKEEGGVPFIINLHSTFIEEKSFGYLSRNDGIPFYFPQKTPYKAGNLIIRNFNKIIGLINTILITKRLQKKNNIKILFYGTSVTDEILLFLFFKLMGIAIIRECSEAPSYITKNSKNLIINTFFLRLRLKMYDHLIVISDYLKHFYSEKFANDAIFQIPILVDMARFCHKQEKKSSGKKVITYVGFMGGNKDGLENLIESMLIVKKRNSNIRLQLVGSADKHDMQRLRNKVSALNLTDMIRFLGKKTTKEIPIILCDSDILVLARPDNNQAKAGFPTKLGEYLASGKPVVITDTGEVSKYLTDNISAYLARPDDVKDFAEKILFALSDRNAVEVGRNGFEIAKENFDYQLYGNQILKIVSS
jgi:glycosyltransferase involved in cell wall biosynthesis